MAHLPVFTVGHSTRTIEEFVALLRTAAVTMVIDIRSVPRSRTNPHYNPEALAPALEEFQIGHRKIAELGGLRKRSKAVHPDVNGFWSNRSFHNYADHALSAEFRAGLARLKGIADERRCAIMCAEAVWWRCHRRIVSDYLLVEGWEVFHLMAKDRIEPAKMTPSAVPATDGLHYPPA